MSYGAQGLKVRFLLSAYHSTTLTVRDEARSILPVAERCVIARLAPFLHEDLTRGRLPGEGLVNVSAMGARYDAWSATLCAEKSCKVCYSEPRVRDFN